MADTKITALTALTAADPANDVIPIVDVSDTTMAASGTTKKISVNNILSSSPTASGAFTVSELVTAGSATISGALTVDTTTLVVDATNDRVGFGTASPSYRIHSVVTSGFAGRFNSSTAVAGGILAGNSTSDLIVGVDASGNGRVTADTSKYLGLGSNGINDRVILDTSSNLSITTGNVVMATSGKGIDFSATASGSGTMTSELLNDYEEGTWVPTVGGTSTYTGQIASYIKVGRLVTVSFDMAILLLGTGSTTTISGLPFVVGSSTSPKFEQCNGACGYLGSLAVNVYMLTFNASANTSTINSISMNTLGGTANVNPAIYGNGTRVQGTVTYMVA